MSMCRGFIVPCTDGHDGRPGHVAAVESEFGPCSIPVAQVASSCPGRSRLRAQRVCPIQLSRAGHSSYQRVGEWSARGRNTGAEGRQPVSPKSQANRHSLTGLRCVFGNLTPVGMMERTSAGSKRSIFNPMKGKITMAKASVSGAASADCGEPHWLIWDGECGFCRRSVAWLAQRDTNRRFRITTYQACPTPPMTPELREEAARAVQVVTNAGEIVSGGRAVLFALEQVGWRPRLARIAARPPLVWLVTLGYRVVANNRQLFSRIFFRSRTDGPAC